MGLFIDNDLSNFMVQQVPKLNEGLIWIRIVDNKITKNFIIDLNTEKQLYDQGIDSEGEILMNQLGKTTYAPLTIKLKRAKGGKAAKVTNITLYDEGDYYESHEVNVDSKGFELDADPQKDDTNLFEEWGKEILGLTEESLQQLINFLLFRYINYTREVIFRR